MTAEKQLIPFSQAIAATRLDISSYSSTLLESCMVGSVPNGGYVASCLLEAASEHMRSKGQSDTLCAHFEFIDRIAAGPAVILVEEVKLGRQLSTLHLTLYQGGLLSTAPWIMQRVSKKKLVAYVTCFNLSLQSGLSLKTSYSPPNLLPINFERVLKDGKDENWGPYAPKTFDNTDFKIRIWEHAAFYVPLRGQHSRSVIDFWVRLKCGELFTNNMLAFLADSWPHVIEGYRVQPGEEPGSEEIPATALMWYSTIVFNLDIKKGLPKGTHWLRSRVEAKEIRNGKLDLETLIFDPDGDLVALSNHVNLVMSADRNMAEPKTRSQI
ncbi:thioesterase-like superfamily-domain-containing protein [Xylariaceae sp. FL0255]|nr:thioesterase-like superfamily-domain-containing protein [Xylariaceae sp. FL0255]